MEQSKRLGTVYRCRCESGTGLAGEKLIAGLAGGAVLGRYAWVPLGAELPGRKVVKRGVPVEQLALLATYDRVLRGLVSRDATGAPRGCERTVTIEARDLGDRVRVHVSVRRDGR